MLRALFSGVSGLKTHQVRMDVIGNNIANVNTIGFKASRVTFREGFAEVLAGATRSTLGQGGINPQQIGSGVRVGSIDPRFNQGALEATGIPLDLAIQGESLFILGNSGQQFFSRAGNFQIDSSGRLVLSGTGFILQGVNADNAGNLGVNIEDIVLRTNDASPPSVTTQVEMAGNLDAEAAVGDTHASSAVIYDERGRSYELDITYTNTGPGAWDWLVTSTDATIAPAAGGTITFNPDGTLNALAYNGGATALTVTTPDGTFDVDLLASGAGGQLRSYAGASTASVSGQDGYEAGELLSLRIDPDGLIQGVYSNGITLTMGQVGMAVFSNSGGLLRTDGNVYESSAASGDPVVGFSGSVTTSQITAGALERSNVDISEEYTNLIVTQRGFQASARVITTADEMLSELINLKR